MAKTYPWPSNFAPAKERARIDAAIKKRDGWIADAQRNIANWTDENAHYRLLLDAVDQWERSHTPTHDVLDYMGEEFSRFNIVAGLTWAAWRRRNASVTLARLSHLGARENLREKSRDLDDDACVTLVVENAALSFTEQQAIEVGLDVYSDLTACRTLLEKGRQQGGEFLQNAQNCIRKKLGYDPQRDWKKA